jgi:hypothetical protein
MKASGLKRERSKWSDPLVKPLFDEEGSDLGGYKIEFRWP